jgi:hypothetical protein
LESVAGNGRRVGKEDAKREDIEEERVLLQNTKLQ